MLTPASVHACWVELSCILTAKLLSSYWRRICITFAVNSQSSRYNHQFRCLVGQNKVIGLSVSTGDPITITAYGRGSISADASCRCHVHRVSFSYKMATFLKVLPTRWLRGRFAYKMAAFLSLTHKMAAWGFCLQDGGVSESFTHKMAAWGFCLQDGGVSESFTHKMAAWEFCL